MKNLILLICFIFVTSSFASESTNTLSTEIPSTESLAPSNRKQVRIGLGREHGMMTQQIIGEMPLGVGMLQAKLSLGNSSFLSDQNEPRETLATSMGYLYPIGESLYVVGSTYYRDYSRKAGTRLDEFKDIGITFAIGNRWSFRSFELNAQWVGASPAVYEIEDRGEKPEMFLTLLNISAGVSF